LTFQGVGYDSVHHGEGRWNGVAILARAGVSDVVWGFDDGGETDDQARLLTGTCGDVRVVTAYVPNGRAVGHEQYDYKLRWLDRFIAHVDTAVAGFDEVVVCGDLNIAPSDLDVYDPLAYVGATHVSPPERDRWARLLDLGLVDVLRARFAGVGGLFSWWDYRAGNFHKHKGMRIDHILVSRPLAARLSWVLVDRNARKGQQPSDHAPLIAEFGPAPL
jgi:exodeoxyribonuclease-3